MPKGIGYGIDKLVNRARSYLKGRKPMSGTRKKMKRAAKKYKAGGEAGEKRGYKVDRKSPIGKLQARNKRMKEMMDEE